MPGTLQQRRVAAAGTVFDPRQLAGLALYLRADRGLYQDTAGTTPVTADTHPVGRWEDQSGQGNHLLQSTADAQPVWRTNRFGAFPAVVCDGTSDFMQSANLGSALAAPLCVFVCVKPASTARQVFIDGKTNTVNRVELYIETGGFFALWGGGGLGSAGTTAANTNAHVLTGVFNTTASALRIDGAPKASGNGGTNTYNGFTLGSRETGLADFSNADYCAALVYTRLLSSAELSRVERWLGRFPAISIA